MRRLCAVVASLPLLAGCAAPEHSDRRPNVLLVVVDTLRADHLGSYGFPLPTSPQVDRIAAGGAVFEHAVAAAPSTVPSHAAILTARYSRELGAGFETGTGRLEAGTTLASVFREAGYATGAFIGNVVLQRAWGFDHGFDVYDDELDTRELNRRGVRERSAENTTRRALAWIDQVRDRPFLLWVHYQDPHGPYQAPPAHAGRFQIPPPPGERPLRLLPGNGGLRGIPAYQALDGVFLPSEYRSRYADEIHYADSWIGELVDAVDDHPSGRDLVLLLTSDHGEAMGEEGRYFVHDFATTPQLAHVPFIVRAPGVAPGRHRQAVGHVDVMPTLLELAGIAPPGGLRGVPLGPLLREGLPLPERWVYCDRGSEISAYRGDGFLRLADAGHGEPAANETGRWERFTWAPDGSWRRVDADVEPDAEIRAFVGEVAPLRPAPLDGETREQLQALGYLGEDP